ncbi:MAG TPA: TIGR03621 family F420-dependent LLM class oxidoreductase [Microthrixaceae bacterium]|nr:TIGR03621 family F420-dependent LLM class oxidoreductase [Microthrixaceae bacterium]
MSRPFRFGVDLQAPLPDRTWADSARDVEDLGYSTLFVPDHFDEGLGPIAAMSVAAAVTSELRIGTLVLDCDYRHPAVLAREIATIDQISGGRIELGLGAGWKTSDYTTAGIPMDPPKVRVDRMIEHVEVLKGCFRGEAFDFDGDHYRIDGLVGTPTPARPGGPPLLIGGGGRRVLSYAARVADIVGVNASVHSGAWDAETVRGTLPERVDERLEWVRAAAGDRFDDIELNSWLAAVEVTDEPETLVLALAEMFGLVDADPKELLDSPFNLLGPLSVLGERLIKRRDRWGLSYVVLPGTQARTLAPLVAELTGR